MMLQQYITEVLFRQQSCTVPQVGTFMVQHIPASFSVVDQTLTPPSQSITFSSYWEDDGSFQYWISQKENLIESVAVIKMEKYLQEFMAALQTGEPMDLPNIGVLQMDPSGHIGFTANVEPDMWQPIALQQVLRPDAAPKVIQGDTEVVNQEVVDHLTVNLDDEERRFRWWWVIVPLLVIAAGVAIWLLRDEWKDYSFVSNKPVVDTPVLAPVVQSTQDSIQPAPPPVNDTISYIVVFQVFNRVNNAENSLKKRHAWGHKNVMMVANEDSTQFMLAEPFTTLRADTTRSLDSLRVKYTSPKEMMKILY